MPEYSVQCTVCTVQYAVCTVPGCSLPCALEYVHAAVCNVHCLTWRVRFNLCFVYSVEYAVCGLMCALKSGHSAQCTVHITQWTVHSVLYTVQCAALFSLPQLFLLLPPAPPYDLLPPDGSSRQSSSDFTQTLPCCFIHRAALRYISLHCTLHSC